MPRDTATVTLVAADGFEFVIDYKAACLSNTIKNSVSSEGAPGAAAAWYELHFLLASRNTFCHA